MAIQAEGICKSYDTRRVLNGISITVQQGEIVGLLGPNGAGKTTTFYAIMGIVPVDGGGITVDGRDVTRLPVYWRARAGIGYLSQEPSIFRRLTVEENIRAAAELCEPDPVGRQRLVEQTLEEFNLTRLRAQKAYTLSGGEKRRCEIARVLVSRPKYLLLDEPFVGVDPKTIEELQASVLALRRRGLGLLLTDHNVRETLAVVDRAYIIYRGDVLIHGTARELVEHPDARRFYLGENFKM
jgi:lipopolysaccharide export system ATP-binding protein